MDSLTKIERLNRARKYICIAASKAIQWIDADGLDEVNKSLTLHTTAGEIVITNCDIAIKAWEGMDTIDGFAINHGGVEWEAPSLHALAKIVFEIIVDYAIDEAADEMFAEDMMENDEKLHQFISTYLPAP